MAEKDEISYQLPVESSPEKRLYKMVFLLQAGNYRTGNYFFALFWESCMISISSNETIQSMVNVIVQCVSPLKIILFGSYARGEEKKGSDIDFVVIEDLPFGQGHSRRKEAAKIWQALMQFNVAKDILIYTSNEFKMLKDNPQSVIGQANKFGRVVYEKTS